MTEAVFALSVATGLGLGLVLGIPLRESKS